MPGAQADRHTGHEECGGTDGTDEDVVEFTPEQMKHIVATTAQQITEMHGHDENYFEPVVVHMQRMFTHRADQQEPAYSRRVVRQILELAKDVLTSWLTGIMCAACVTACSHRRRP
jgi:hypothetical protein